MPFYITWLSESLILCMYRYFLYLILWWPQLLVGLFESPTLWMCLRIPDVMVTTNIGVSLSQIARFMGPTWGPPGPCRPHMGPILAPWTLLSVFVADGQGKHPALIDLYGSPGGLLEHRAAMLASRGFVTLALAYFGYQDLPKKPRVDCDYFLVHVT